ncbi:MAG: hypothetical protein Q7U98_01090 [Methylicorpusculum sp.]|uniref:hypothetical protein n=1 Tax=Methylicorpusculum sp. TaxID=2713644 RepID=UPI0027241E76|nr:hypothetical protein [Methylicorpusculum sp.]MDO8937735.1 hypothetical protein [Methylicorpusculum sp.]
MAALEKREWQKWVARRPSSLQIHRRKAVNEIPIPESSHSSPSSIDPNRSVGFLQTGQPDKSRFSELEDYKAVIGDLPNSASRRP